jgi:hypothetical protein
MLMFLLSPRSDLHTWEFQFLPVHNNTVATAPDLSLSLLFVPSGLRPGYELSGVRRYVTGYHYLALGDHDAVTG